ncbi:unnamed protein product, partial [Closterium sp. NIES-54]
MFQHIKDLVELDDSGPKAWKLLRDVIQPNTLAMVSVLEKELAALSMRPGDDVKPVLDKIKDTYARMAAAGSNVSQMQQCTKIISRISEGATQLVVLPTKLLRGMELQEAIEEEGEGEAEAVGEALAEGEAEVTTMRGMGALVVGGALEWRVLAGAQGDGAHGKADPGMFLMVEDVKGSEGDVGSVGKVVMHPLTHWVIDSGCTSHMTPPEDLLGEVKPPGNIQFVAAALGTLLPVNGVGNAKVLEANGGLVGLGNVLLVEGLSANLLSVRRLQISKAKVTFGPNSCRAKLGKLLLWDLEENSCIKDLWQLPIIPWNGKPPATAAAAATAKATAGGEETAPTDGALDAVKKVQQTQRPDGEVLAGLDATAAWAKASSGSGEADWETWHERLCHLKFPMLQKLVKDGSLKGLEVKGAAKEIGSCPTCLETKFTKFPFNSSTRPAKAPLALVHMDVVGPTRAPSLPGSRYFLTIVDDHTRAVWVFPLKTKGEVAAAVLKDWMPRAQRESGHKVKLIRTDNRGEFLGAGFEAVLKKKGIQHQLTVPYNPQQNGMAERFNRTLQEGARTLLGRAELPDPFWVTALRHVALVKNRVFATVRDKQWVPYAKWYGKPLGAVSTMARPEERGGRGAGGTEEAQAQGQPRDSAMAPMQPSIGPPRDEPRVFELDKFNGDNFSEWSFKMENIFYHYDLLEVMEGTEKRPENDPEKSPWVRKSAQGYFLLGQALGSSQIGHIKPFQREPEKGPKAWAALKDVHAPATAAVAVVLERQMAALRIEEDEAVEEGVHKFFDLLTRLEGADLNYSELQKKTKLQALLPESWSSLIINLNRDLPRLSLEDVKRAILQEDFRRRELASADGAGAASIGRGYGRGRGRGRGGGRFGGNNFNRGRGSSRYGNDNKNNRRGRGRFDGECHFCHKGGHMWRDCYKLPDGWTPAQGQKGRGAGGGRGRGRGGRGSRGCGAASMKSASNESESRDDRFPGQFFFVSTQASAFPEKDEGFEEPAAVGKVTLHSLDYWVTDSGGTYSMTPRADLLTELEPSPVKHVTSALRQRAEVKGMGNAMFKGADGKIVGLKN